MGGLIIAEKCFNNELKLYDYKKGYDNTYFAPWDATVTVDSEGVIINVSGSIEKILPLRKEEMFGKKPEYFIERGIIKYSVKPLHIEGKMFMGILQNIVSGRVVEAFVYSMVRYDKEGNQRFVEHIFWDMTNGSPKGQESNLYNMFFMQCYLKLKKQQINKEKIIYQSDKMKKIIDLAHKVSQVDCNILLEGESGVGKEVISKLIHETSSRNNHQFVSINCAAMPEQLLEAELFGYESGTFTGANKKGKIGLIESAHNGTLFLDEINSFPLSLQAKLLRVIETKEVRQLGSTSTKKVNFRLISATNKNLKELVEKNLFREDLLYRLNVIPIFIPSLRERKKDIKPLTYYFLQSLNDKYKANKEFSAEAVIYLEKYNWPGNVRELKNIVERLVVLSPNPVITIEDLPSEILGNEKVNKRFKIIINELPPLQEFLKEAESQLIRKALEQHKTTRAVAKALQISPATVVRKMRN